MGASMKRHIFFALSICLCLSWLAWAQGVMVTHWPPPHRHPYPPPLPPPDFRPHALSVKSIQFESSIQNQVAKTHVVQVFLNDAPYVLEGAYFFPLPDEASISDFVIYDGDKKIRGEVLERERARQTYESIIREIRDPGLLEYAGKNLFQARIFPIPGRGEKKIELEYSQILKADAGLVRYVYPLGTGGRTISTPILNVSGRVHIKSPVPIKNIYSPSHTLSTKRDGDLAATVGFEVSDRKPTSDFQLYYSLSEKEFGLSLLTYRQQGEDGYFMLLLSPKTDIKSGDVSKKDIVFVIDVSGSMSDRGKIEKAREALKFGIRTLNEGDRFNIISFATEEESFSSELVAASKDNTERAQNYVGSLRAAGGTNIYDALTAALKKFPATDRPQYLIFLTDGLPTVGEANVDRILDRAREFNKSQIRIFSFGFGYDVNTFLLDQLATSNNGSPDYVAPEEDLELKVSNFFEKVNYPVLSDINLSQIPSQFAGEIPGLSLSELYPKQAPDIFKGTQLTLLGKYSGSGKFAVRVTGKYLNTHRNFTYADQSFPKEATEADFLPRLWASRKVGYLLDQIRLHGESSELKDEVVRLAKKYGFVTPYTSYLAADDSEMTRRRWRPAGVPGGVAGGILGHPSPAGARAPGEAMAIDAKDLSAQTGAIAVTTSQAITSMKLASYLTDNPSSIQVVGEKTFIQQNEVWVDSEYDATKNLPFVRLKYGSDEYYKLLAQQPALGKFLALGENVTVVFGGKVYEIRK